MLKRGKKLLLAVALAAAASGLLLCAAAAGEGARQGLRVCYAVIIPSLFPFLALSTLVAATPVSQLLERLFGPLTRRLYGAPRAFAPAVVLSWIGGYPAGARVLAEMTAQKRISPREAAWALPFCVNSGPAFMTGVIGVSIFGSVKAGLGLFGCQLVAGILTARLMRCGRKLSAGKFAQVRPPFQPFSVALVGSVRSAASGIIAICAFVILFSAIIEILRQTGTIPWLAALLSSLSGGQLTQAGAECLIAGGLEVCAGSAQAQQLPVRQAALILPFLLSFASASVLFQVASCFESDPVPMGPFLMSRCIHGLLTELLAAPWLLRYSRVVQTMAQHPGVLAVDHRTVASTIGLLVLCALLAAVVETDPQPRCPMPKFRTDGAFPGQNRRKTGETTKI